MQENFKRLQLQGQSTLTNTNLQCHETSAVLRITMHLNAYFELLINVNNYMKLYSPRNGSNKYEKKKQRKTNQI